MQTLGGRKVQAHRAPHAAATSWLIPSTPADATGSEVAGHSGPRNSRRAGHAARGFHAFAEWFAGVIAEYRESVRFSSVAARAPPRLASGNELVRP